MTKKLSEHIEKSASSGLRRWIFYLAPVLSLYVFFFADIQPGSPQVTAMLAVVIWVAAWWVTELIPLGITSLLPLVLYPVLGIMDGEEVAATYFNDVIFLFMGGFLMAIAIQKWNLHVRVALTILKWVGLSPARILFGFMLATTFISMWISNTATTMMMIPILLSVLSKLEEKNEPQRIQSYATGTLLAVAYSATLGGIATLVGTPPNLSFVRIFEMYFPDADPISFSTWFAFAFPVTVILFLVFYVYLYFRFVRGKSNWAPIQRAALESDLKKLGPPSTEEKQITVVFLIMALLWFFRVDVEMDNFVIPGWSGLFQHPEFFTDGTVAVFCGLILFILPSRKKHTRLMNWKDAENIPWEIILLFGGGFALASGMKSSGLAAWCGEELTFLDGFHPLFVILLITLFITFLGELASNTAMVETFLPVLAALAVGMGVNPLFFMIPATLGASMGFMLPVATPPNAIAFATRRIQMSEMIRTGFFLNLLSVTTIALAMYLFGQYVFGIDLTVLPDWAF